MTQQEESFNCTAFFEGLATRIETLKELRQVYNEQMAFDFIATRFFHPDENKFSEILAFFLDPKESHGQGDTFLRIFCEKFLPDYAWKDWLECGVVIRTEHATSEKRRIDITIKLGEQFIVGVENKIYDWTAEQAQQAEHYCNEMDNTHPGQFLFLYLTPNGLIPSEHSISKRFREELEGKEKPQFRCISYREDIHDLLEQWATACKAPTVESFIRDFNKYIQYRYIGVRNMDMAKSIVKYLNESDDVRYLEAAIHIHQNIEAVQESLWKKTRTWESDGLASSLSEYRMDKLTSQISQWEEQHSPFDAVRKYGACHYLLQYFVEKVEPDVTVRFKVDMAFESNGDAFILLWVPEWKSDGFTAECAEREMNRKYEQIKGLCRIPKKEKDSCRRIFKLSEYDSMCEMDEAIYVYLKELLAALRKTRIS